MLCFFFNDTATTEIYTYVHSLSLHDALPISPNSNGQTGQIIRPQTDRWPPERVTSPETGSQHLLASFVQIPVGVRSFDDEPPIPAQGRPSYALNRSGCEPDGENVGST